MPKRNHRRPKLAVWKFSSCDGCQLTMLDCEDELLEIAGEVEIAYFLEASRAVIKGPYDLSIVEGSIATPEDIQRIKDIRRQSTYLVAMGACATGGGIQALRNFANARDYMETVYAKPEYLNVLEQSLPTRDYVSVDLELPGCSPSKTHLLEVITAVLAGRNPFIPSHSLCIDCKRRDIVCVMVAQGTPCLGPVTQVGCGVLCPDHRRGCYGCYGPMESPDTPSLDGWITGVLGQKPESLKRLYRTYNAVAPAFKEASERHAEAETADHDD